MEGRSSRRATQDPIDACRDLSVAARVEPPISRRCSASPCDQNTRQLRSLRHGQCGCVCVCPALPQVGRCARRWRGRPARMASGPLVRTEPRPLAANQEWHRRVARSPGGLGLKLAARCRRAGAGARVRPLAARLSVYASLSARSGRLGPALGLRGPTLAEFGLELANMFRAGSLDPASEVRPGRPSDVIVASQGGNLPPQKALLSRCRRPCRTSPSLYNMIRGKAGEKLSRLGSLAPRLGAPWPPSPRAPNDEHAPTPDPSSSVRGSVGVSTGEGAKVRPGLGQLRAVWLKFGTRSRSEQAAVPSQTQARGRARA